MWESGPLGTGRSAAAQFLPLFHANPGAAVKAVSLRFSDGAGGTPGFQRPTAAGFSCGCAPRSPHRGKILALARTSGASPYWDLSSAAASISRSPSGGSEADKAAGGFLSPSNLCLIACP